MNHGTMLRFRVAGTQQVQTRYFKDDAEGVLLHGEHTPRHVEPMLARNYVVRDGKFVPVATVPIKGTHWDWHEMSPFTY